jgi:hypothetical protein
MNHPQDLPFLPVLNLSLKLQKLHLQTFEIEIFSQSRKLEHLQPRQMIELLMEQRLPNSDQTD